MQTSSSTKNRNVSFRPSMPTKPLALPPSTDARRALGSPDRRAGAKRLRGITAPIRPTNYLQNHRTNFSHLLHSSTNRLHDPSPPPFGRYLDRRERQGLCANFKQLDKPQFHCVADLLNCRGEAVSSPERLPNCRKHRTIQLHFKLTLPRAMTWQFAPTVIIIIVTLNEIRRLL